MDNYTEKHKGVNYICLEMMLIDKFRVFANPSTYNRLTKEFKRLAHFIEFINIKKFISNNVKNIKVNNNVKNIKVNNNVKIRDLKSYFI